VSPEDLLDRIRNLSQVHWHHTRRLLPDVIVNGAKSADTLAAKRAAIPGAVDLANRSVVDGCLREIGEATPRPQHNHVRPRLEPFYYVLQARVGEQADATIAELRAWMSWADRSTSSVRASLLSFLP
jgi:hypothetical protein